MAPARADHERQARPEDIGSDRRSFLDRFVAQQPRIGVSTPPEGHNACVFRPCMCRQLRKMLIVGRENGCSASLETVEDLRFRVRNLGNRLEELDVDRGHPGYDRDVRSHEASQRRDFSCVVHAYLEHAAICVFRHSRDR